MKSKFLKLYNVIMEDLQSDQQFEFEDMTLAIVPGSFKPPHKGHWEMVMNYVDKVDKVIVLISNISTKAISSRPLSLSNLQRCGKIVDYAKTKLKDNQELQEKLNVNAENLSFDQLSEILNLILEMNIEDNKFNSMIQKYLDALRKGLFGSIRKTANNTEITPEMSKEIFEIFAKAYGVQDKVDIRISESASPINATYGLVNNACKNCKILLGVSNKGGDEARWNDLKQSEENPTNQLISSPVDVQTMLSATQLREGINNLQKDWFPENLSNEDFQEIKNILNK